MPASGSESTKLIIIRGNSASGKTTAAWEIRRRFHHRSLAIVSQDVLRREILRVKGEGHNPAPGLIDLTARYALDHGFHVVVEGILGSPSHGEMLTQLVRDHAGETACFYYDIPFDETVARHASKPQAAEYGAEMMREWYRDRDLIPALNEHIFGPEVSQDAAVRTMMEAVNMPIYDAKDES